MEKQKKTQAIRKRNMFPKTLAQIVDKATKPAMKKHGLPEGLITTWPMIAGKELAGYCTPIACKRSKKDTGATLVLSVSPSHSLMAQHASGIIQEKINLHYGYQVISRIQLKPMMVTPAPQHPQPNSQHEDLAEQFAALAKRLKND